MITAKTATLTTLAAMATLLSLPAHAEAPPFDPGSCASAKCEVEPLKRLRAGTPATTVFRTGSYCGLSHGEHTLGELVDACRANALGPNQEHLANAIDYMLTFAERLDRGESKDTYELDREIRSCKHYAEHGLAVDMDPATPIKAERWQGVLGDVAKDACTRGQAAVERFYATKLADHKKVLKNDKWKMLVQSYPDGYVIPGGNGWRTADAKALAKATLWFDVSSRAPGAGDACATKVFIYYRYQFDRAGKLVKESSQTYCGDPGKRALR